MLSMGSGLMGGLTSPVPGDPSGQQPAMAFTYVPVPVYNIGGVTTMPGMPMMPGRRRSVIEEYRSYDLNTGL